MENYIVSFRKYRPASFDMVVGQHHITGTLKNAIKTQQLAQAFLFCGPRGVGKTTCARIFAKTINCTQLGEDGEACNSCDSCVSFNRGGSMAIHELDAASNNSVDDIRSLVEQVRYAPQGSKYKIYIIDEVHMLSTAAFNAFLKTLEEPPSYAIFILATTEKHKILPTILSRCQIFDFNRIKVEDIAMQLESICKQEGITYEYNALHVIAQKADGALRDALSIMDQVVSFSGGQLSYAAVIENLNIIDHDYYFKVTEALLMQDLAGVSLLLEEVISKGFEGINFITGLAGHFRNLLMTKDPRTVKLLEVSDDIKARYQQQTQQAPAGFLLTALNFASYAEVNYKQAKQPRLLVELALMKMCFLNQMLYPEQLAQEVKKKSSADAPAVVDFKIPAPAAIKIQGVGSSAGNGSYIVEATTANPSHPAAAQTAAIALEPLAPVAPIPPPPLDPDSADANPPQKTETAAGAALEHANTHQTEQTSPAASTIAINKVPVSATASTKGTKTMAGGMIKVGKNLAGIKTAVAQVDEADAATSAVLEQGNLSFAEAWQKVLAEIKAARKDYLFSILNEAQPVLNEAQCFQIAIHSEAQQQIFDPEKQEILEKIRHWTGNFSIDFQYVILEKEAEAIKLVTSADKFGRMAEKNPHLLTFVNAFGLDIDY
ncbi:MAG: DNA polymerase III subunit gamma/tau [Sphingobacteriaceae bacterium]|nr:DNA polymerase III subunit gamma/tau [Sphingobacteriaceae bacterium]